MTRKFGRLGALAALLILALSLFRAVKTRLRSAADSEFTFRSDPRLVFELARDRLQTQLAFADAMDSKLGALFAAASAIIGLLAAIFAIQSSTLGSTSTPMDLGAREALILIIALGLFAVVVVSGIAAWPRIWQTGPSVEDAFRDAQRYPLSDFTATQISGYVESWNENKPKNALKAWALRLSYVAVTGEVACLVAAIWPLVY